MNLVRMWGFCSEGRHRLLVYEYVENSSLDKHLFAKNFLPWKERFKVAIGTAKALAYLHHERLEWVADFGLAKLAQRGSPGLALTRVRGTKGYGAVILEMARGIRLSNWAVKDDKEVEAELSRFVRTVKTKAKVEKSLVESMTKTMFTLQILHGGKLVQGEQVTYDNGNEHICTVDSDFMSYFELMDIMKDIGYPNHPVIYYKLPNFDMNTGLVELTSDVEIVHMFDVHVWSDVSVIEIFVHTPDLVDVFSNSDSEWHDDVQIDSDKEAFSGMEESSTGDEEEMGDKEGGKGKQPKQTMSQGTSKDKIVSNKSMGCNTRPPLQSQTSGSGSKQGPQTSSSQGATLA
ncbi:lectin protein kinase family protein [Actinidia rufa]|uniref:Lectin protein kinase family protein n=1 Tax=Actinidia rufa TaxID=165716 RepID=A0A7J0E768_9ERIC|nr:lectin protein kinase family protein [Actinidia rufa]